MFRKTLLARALTIAFGAAALSAGVVAPVMAQSNATGNILGRVESAAGSQITITNTETGLKKQLTPNADGRYQFTALPAGHYKVTLSRNGANVSTQEVDVLAGQGAEASFASGTQTVQVTTRRNKIDVSNTNNGATFTAKELAKLPITPSLDSIIQLAPNTTRADSRYAGGQSFGGGGASENAYYINGFPVTNPLTQLGSSELPFGAIQQADILTGGFGAEFGRSVGGVVNITTKSGTNNWEVGATFAITPDSLRAKSRDLYYGKTGAPENNDRYESSTGDIVPQGTPGSHFVKGTDGTIYRKRDNSTSSTQTTGAYVGGPIIKDKLFMFFAGESINARRSGLESATGAIDNTLVAKNGWTDRNDRTQRYLGKFDWNLSDNHRLELTLIGDDAKSDLRLSGYNYNDLSIPLGRQYTTVSNQHYANIANETPTIGGDAQILKYTGNLTQDLTLTTLYGQSTVKHTNTFDGYDINQELFQVVAPESQRAPGINYSGAQPLTGNINPPGAKDLVKSFRLDVEYKLGSHKLRAGLDNNKLETVNGGDFLAGGGQYSYKKTPTPNTPISLGNGPRVAVATGGGLGTQGYYVRRRIFNDVTQVYSDQQAEYIEDAWNVTKDILITGGLRNESFQNKNGDKVTFLEQKNQLAPRLSASWNVNGDGSTKVYGSAGRYTIQIPTHIGIRGASRSTFTDQFFTYTGVDANGAPTGRVALTEPRSADNEYGQAKDPLVVSSRNLDPTYQDEISFGFEKALTPDFNGGVKATYRKLQSTIDDFCDQRPFDAWAARNNVSTANWSGFGCATFNPGRDQDFLVDFNNADPALAGKTHTLVHLTKQDLASGNPANITDPKRSFFSVDFFAEHPFRNQWYGKITYSWSRNRGNTEGQTLSDVAQTDVSATQTWDHAELDAYANGLLPNDRTHQIKAYGFYEVTPEWIVGANFLMASGRPVNCLGNHPDPTFDLGYGSSYHYCNGKPSPRGSLGRLPWDINLDLNLVYKPKAIKDLTLKVDVFNFFNKQTVQNIDETYNDGDNVSATYGRPFSYTAPRSVRLTAEYNHKF